jgi:hypothetical protein
MYGTVQKMLSSVLAVTRDGVTNARMDFYLPEM